MRFRTLNQPRERGSWDHLAIDGKQCARKSRRCDFTTPARSLRSAAKSCEFFHQCSVIAAHKCRKRFGESAHNFLRNLYSQRRIGRRASGEKYFLRKKNYVENVLQFFSRCVQLQALRTVATNTLRVEQD
jgi:hypothetical protein